MSMKIQNLVQVQADVVRITTLQEGSIYRRITEKSSYDKSATVKYGIVTGIVSDGETTALTAVELPEGWGDAPTPITFSGDSEVVILPCDTPEFLERAELARSRQLREITTAESELLRKRHVLSVLESVVSGATQLVSTTTRHEVTS